VHPSIRLFLVAALLACSSPRPSQEYERALSLWNEVLRADPDAAADDPRTDEVLQRLGLVPADSSDASAAVALRSRIESERRLRATERSRREEVLRRASTPAAPVTMVASVGGAGSAGNVASEPKAPRVPAIATGLKAEAFRQAYGSCFFQAGEVAVTAATGPARPGELWSLKEDRPCRDAHPGLVDQVVILADGVVAGVRPAKEVRRYEIHQKVELATLPDGRPGMVVDGKIVPIPPGAKVLRTDAGGTAP
jgi:hypothetical protein